MAAGAVALVRILEQLGAPLLLFGEFDVTAQVGIVAAAVRIELLGHLLERRKGPQARGEGPVRMPENVRAEQCLELRRIGCPGEFARDVGRTGIGHFIGGQQRQLRLLLETRGAPVPHHSADGAGITIQELELLFEGGYLAQIAQRGDGAGAGEVHARPAEGDGPSRRGAVGVLRIMAGRTGLLAGG